MPTSTRTVLLIPFTLDTVRPTDSDETRSPEGELLSGLDDAYNHGQLPDDLTWHLPISADLPEGWRWIPNGAETLDGRAVCVVNRGGVRFADLDGCLSCPVAVMAAVIARFNGKAEDGR